jgi:hypothetical protein
MKRLHRLDFMAPASRPWAGYVLLLLAVLTTGVVFELLWRTRTAALPEAGVAGSAARIGPTHALSATPPAAATFASSAGLNSAADAWPASQSDAGTAADRLQVGKTRSIAGTQALPWAYMLATLQVHASARVELLRIEPYGGAQLQAPTAGSVHVIAQGRSNADIDAFLRALRADARLRDVSIPEAPGPADQFLEPRPGDSATRRPGAADTTWLRFAAVASWRAPAVRPRTEPRADSSAGESAATSAASTHP